MGPDLPVSPNETFHPQDTSVSVAVGDSFAYVLPLDSASSSWLYKDDPSGVISGVSATLIIGAQPDSLEQKLQFKAVRAGVIVLKLTYRTDIKGSTLPSSFQATIHVA